MEERDDYKIKIEQDNLSNHPVLEVGARRYILPLHWTLFMAADTEKRKYSACCACSRCVIPFNPFPYLLR